MVSRHNGRSRNPLVRDIKFPLGDLHMTPGVQESIPPSEVLQALRRHANGDWGTLDVEDHRANDDALKEQGRLLSAYFSGGRKFWIITEADRSTTTVLLPEEY